MKMSIILGVPYNSYTVTLSIFSLPTLDSKRSHPTNSFGYTLKENDYLHKCTSFHDGRHRISRLSGVEQNDIESPLCPIWLGCSVILITIPK